VFVLVRLFGEQAAQILNLVGNAANYTGAFVVLLVFVMLMVLVRAVLVMLMMFAMLAALPPGIVNGQLQFLDFQLFVFQTFDFCPRYSARVLPCCWRTWLYATKSACLSGPRENARN
jgi:hypothetical protein